MDPHHAGPAIYKEVSEPDTPDSGFVLVYAGTDGALHTKDDAGTVADLGGGITSSNSSINDIVALTQAEYDALSGSEVSTTLYIITD